MRSAHGDSDDLDVRNDHDEPDWAKMPERMMELRVEALALDDEAVLRAVTAFKRTNSIRALGRHAWPPESPEATGPAVLPPATFLCPYTWPMPDANGRLRLGDIRERTLTAEVAARRSLHRLVAAGRVVASNGDDGRAATLYSLPEPAPTPA